MDNTSNNKKGNVGTDENKDEKIEYPDGLQNSDEVKQQENAIDTLLKEYREEIKGARESYEVAYKALYKMGQQHKRGEDILEKVAQEMSKLKTIIIKPLI